MFAFRCNFLFRFPSHASQLELSANAKLMNVNKSKAAAARLSIAAESEKVT